MSSLPTELFTAAAIAQALGCSKQNIHQRLAPIPADGEQLNGGNLAKAWKRESLPASLDQQLCAKAVAKGYRTVCDLLREPFGRYEPEVPLAEIAPHAIDAARKWRAALREILPIRNDAGITAAQLAERGIAAFKREFGYAVTSRYWRAFFDRTIERDNGAEEWTRLEIYVEENPPRISSRRPISIARERGLEVVELALSSLAGVTSLTVRQKAYLWMKVCDELQLQVEGGEPEKRVKRAILKVLLASGLFGTRKETIRWNLNRQWAAYVANNGWLEDRRTLRDQRRKLPEADRDKLIARSVDCDGRESQADRELRDDGGLSEETLAGTIANPSRKSYMRASTRREITPDVNRLMSFHRGEREHELRGPYVPQDDSRIAAGQVMQLDDVTLPVYYWEDDPDSPSGIFFGRGQWILAIDVRSRMILGHALHSAPVYNMRIVRSLMLRVHDGYGLPECLLLECGMWRTAKILKGDELAMGHTEQGLREFGIRFQHRTRPCGKIIERVIGLLQNQMERVPGYAGRDERHDRFERTQEQVLAVTSGREHPSNNFLHKADWLQQLDQIIHRYNHERQEGKLQATPVETWNANLLKQGTVQLGEKARFLLAHHKKPVKVQSRGIRLPPSLGGGLYYNGVTGRFAGERMIAWINPDELEAISLTSLDLRDGPYIVERANPLPPIGATEAELARAQAQIAAHNGYARTRYRVIQDHLARRSFRRLLVDRSTAELGARVTTQTTAAKQERQKKARSVNAAQRLVRERGINVQVDATNAERAKVAADLAGGACDGAMAR